MRLKSPLNTKPIHKLMSNTTGTGPKLRQPMTQQSTLFPRKALVTPNDINDSAVNKPSEERNESFMQKSTQRSQFFTATEKNEETDPKLPMYSTVTKSLFSKPHNNMYK